MNHLRDANLRSGGLDPENPLDMERFKRSARGRFILAKALYLMSEALKDAEPSDAADAAYLLRDPALAPLSSIVPLSSPGMGRTLRRALKGTNHSM